MDVDTNLGVTIRGALTIPEDGYPVEIAAAVYEAAQTFVATLRAAGHTLTIADISLLGETRPVTGGTPDGT